VWGGAGRRREQGYDSQYPLTACYGSCDVRQIYLQHGNLRGKTKNKILSGCDQYEYVRTRCTYSSHTYCAILRLVDKYYAMPRIACFRSLTCHSFSPPTRFLKLIAIDICRRSSWGFRQAVILASEDDSIVNTEHFRYSKLG
jgi:hypothetical protein